jgi:hypothetical protein
LNGVPVLLGGAAGLGGLTGQLPGCGDGHGGASRNDPAEAGVDGALLRGRPYFHHRDWSPGANVSGL